MKKRLWFLAVVSMTTGLFADMVNTATSGLIQGAWGGAFPSAANRGILAVDGTWTTDDSTDFFEWVVVQQTGTLSRDNTALLLNNGVKWYLENGIVSSGSSHVRIGDTGTAAELIMSGGQVTAADRFDVNYQSLLDMSGGSVSAARFLFTRGGTVKLSGGIMTGESMDIGSTGGFLLELAGGAMVINGAIDVRDRPDAIIRFGAGNGSLSAESIAYAGTGGRIDFISGSQGSFTITGFAAADFEQLWTDGHLMVDGSNTGTFSELFSVDGNTLTMVPEPATASVFVMSSLGLYFMRRATTR